MATEFIQGQIQRLLNEAADAITRDDWRLVQQHANGILRLDPGNLDALSLLDAAGRGPTSALAGEGPPAPSPAAAAEGSAAAKGAAEGVRPHPTSFVSDRYQVVRFLGEGATKRVYLAHDTKLDRDVAFALIKTDGLDPEGLTRIRREAQAMARLGDHPHVVTVHDIGDEGGQPYIVSQFMPGGDISALLPRGEGKPLPLEALIRMTDEVCQALEHAHGQGIVHRDLKPGNVWLDASGAAKLGDFGLALSLDRSRLTQAGMMVGTVAYMAPEQALGGEVTPRSDLYSLGAMLYELVTGRPPFIGDESVAIITQHLSTPPVAPSWHRPGLSAGLEALILRLLEKDPAKRPASAAEVRAALASVGSPSPPVPSPPGTGEGVNPASPAPIYRRAFIGREQELRQLQSGFDRTLSGAGALAMVVGEPGIGKTALCEQLATYVAIRGGRTLVGHSYEEGSLSLPYLAFVEALRTYVLAQEPDQLREQLGTGAGDVARIVSEVRERLNVEPRPRGDPEDDQWRLLQAVVGFLASAASVQPLLLVLEDLHWADRGTLDLLTHLARNLGSARLLVVGTYRDMEVDRAHPLSAALAELRRAQDFDRVLLRGLTADEVHRMLSTIAGQDVRWGLAEAVHRQTEGNPLFVQEVLRYLVEEGLIVRQEGRWEGRGRGTGQPLPELSIPEGLRDVIGRRLSKLSPDCNRLLATAAVAGRDFGLETLRRVANIEEEPMVAALEEAMGVGVLEEHARPGVIRYRFSHALFRQTLYEELSAPRRLRLHQAVARALEEQYSARPEEHAAELAEHFSQSTDPADLEKAVTYAELGATRAVAVYAYPEAVRLLSQALEVQEVLDPDPSTGSGQAGAKRCDLLLALADVLLPVGEPLRVTDDVAEEALALAETLGDRQRASRACRLALDGLFRYGGGSMPGSLSWARWTERADRYAEAGTLDRVYADYARGQQGRATGWLAGADGGRSDSLRALELARELGDPEALFVAAFPFLANPASQHLMETFEIADEIAALPRERVSATRRASVLLRLVHPFLARGDRARMEEFHGELRELATRSGDPFALTRAALLDVRLSVLDGHLEEAVAQGYDLIARGEEWGLQLARSFVTSGLGQPLVWLGRADAAVELDQALVAPRAGRASTLFAEVEEARVREALHLARAGREANASVRLNEFLGASDFAAESDLASDTVSGHALLVWLEAGTVLGDREAARRLLPQVSDLAPFIWSFGLDCFAAGRVVGAAAAMLGQPGEATTYYRQALDVCERARFRPEIALIRLGLAELLLNDAVGDQPPVASNPDGGARLTADELKAECSEQLQFVIPEFEAMKMAPSLEQALTLQSRLGA